MRPYYEQHGITIYHGDCREIAPLLAVEFDAVIADPPYDQTSLGWDRWPSGWPDTMALVSRSLWCFGSLRMFLDRKDEFSEWQLSQDVVWEKHNGSGFAADRFKRVHDQAVHFYRGDWSTVYHETPKVQYGGPVKTVRKRGQTPHTGTIGNTGYVDDGSRLIRSVMFAPSMHGNAENETQKPEVIVAPLVEYACPRGGIILAPFCGSGTDVVVARVTGRRAVGMDVREEQCEKAANRLQQLLPMEFTA
jgi:site-specific DNA-methyltransferase (adenine-specific)